MSVVRYDKATGPSGGPTPGALALRDHWKAVTGLPRVEIYNPRPVRGTKRTWSTHAEGRGIDLYANALAPGQKATADRYCQFLIDNAVPIRCQYLIWDKRSWKSGRGWSRYTGVHPHQDHIHVELNHDGARDTTVALLNALWSEWNGDHDKPPQEEPEMDPRAAARIIMRVLLGRGPKDEAELQFHAGEVRKLGEEKYLTWLEVQPEAQAWARRIGAEVRSPDA